MATDLPTLDTVGWVSDPKLKAERLIAYFLVAEASQSNIFQNRVQSFPALLQSHGGNVDLLATETERAIGALFKGYFDGVTVNISAKASNPDSQQSGSEYTLVIGIIVTDANVQYSLGRSLSISNKILSKVTNISRG